MAREFAKMWLSMWADDDFRALTRDEQHLYLVMMGAQSLSYCGVADWRPSRIAPLTAGWTADEVVVTAASLVDKLYFVVDESTEELLVRSFIRHDKIMKQPKMAIAMAKAHAVVSSAVLRGVIVHELNRLREADPDLKAWGEQTVREVLAKASVDPSGYPLGKGSGWASVKGSVSGNPDPSDYPQGNPPSYPPRTTTNNLQLTTTNNPQPNSLRELDAGAPARAKPKRHLPDDWEPNDNHRDFATKHGIDLDHEANQFRSHAAANDRRQADWHAAFRTWLGNNVKWQQSRATPEPAEANGFQLPAAPKDIIDDPDPSAYVRWAREQRDAWHAERSPA